MSDFTSISCSDGGISGTTPIYIRKTADGFVARVGISILGTTNLPEKELKAANPFLDFRDNYAEGKGKTEAEALEALRADIRKMSDTLWL